MTDVGVEPAGEQRAVRLENRELCVLVVLALAFRHRPAERLGDARCHTREVVVVAGGSENAAIDAVVTVLCTRFGVVRDEPVALANGLDDQVERIRRRRKLERIDARLAQFLVGIAQDDRNLEVVRLVARAQINVLQVAGGTGALGVVTGFDHEPASEQFIVEIAERRVLDDEQHVEVVGRLQPLTDALPSLRLKLVD